ncbi:hypothetical protein [Xenorhabdus cabanillasii]|uniref:Uncharacterized protein n=1 Tax=Xenorhabdus cabanillasii JM26 TaxID=1427517 RepID=W1IQS3_9GAMM|nr:hypothetical protein [Xenorhabdus cabanillasii]PHM76059.1 hypothetical protein Xcab_03441 [Xenorhabdus cabanillasii JM26]CDL80193.1 conserved hypothetical protein [Xenorhabdus cabanillasii JM26]
MVAIDRNTPHRDGELFSVPCEAGAQIGGGHLVCVNAAGFAVPGSANAGLTVIGVADEFADNRAGKPGEQTVRVRRGRAFYFDNDSAQPVAQAQVGQSCTLTNSVTVKAIKSDNKLPVVGRVLEVSISDGVLVLIQ